MTEDDPKRRTFLRGTGATLLSTGVIGLAGCSGDGGSDGGDGSDGGSDGGDGSDGGSDGGGDSGGDGGDGGSDEPTYPEEDLRVIIPYSPGGGYDTYARLVAEHMADHLPTDVNVQPQNVEGAGGRIAVEELYNEDDDHTIGMMHISNFSQMQLVEDDVEWDMRDFTWLPTVASDTYCLAVGPHTGLETFEEVAEAIDDGSLSPASSGPTAGGTVSTIVLGEKTGLWSADSILDNLVVVDGKSQAVQMVMGEDADYADGTPATFRQYVESGDLNTVIFSHESPDWSDAPTFEEAEIENAEEIQKFVVTPRGFAAPPDIPEERADVLRQAISDAIQSDEFLADAEEAKRPISYADSEETLSVVETKIELWEDSPEILELFE
ncbi:MAG: Bug family tripartite tricarboxylate transporter substrate binding protein [Haloferacaceae archaeon]